MNHALQEIMTIYNVPVVVIKFLTDQGIESAEEFGAIASTENDICDRVLARVDIENQPQSLKLRAAVVRAWRASRAVLEGDFVGRP